MYVVAGVSGKTGAAVADNLLRAGKPLRVIVRAAEKGEAWRARGAEVAIASLDDEQAVARALDGAMGAYLLSPVSPASPDPIAEGWRLADAMARAVERSRLPHLVFLSSMGASHAEGTGIVRTLHAAEVRLSQSTAQVTFVRASYFLDEWLTVLGAVAGGQLPTLIRPERVVPMVAARDIGAVAARALLEGPPAGARQVIAVRGPGDYSPRDLAAVLTELAGPDGHARIRPAGSGGPAADRVWGLGAVRGTGASALPVPQRHRPGRNGQRQPTYGPGHGHAQATVPAGAAERRLKTHAGRSGVRLARRPDALLLTTACSACRFARAGGPPVPAARGSSRRRSRRSRTPGESRPPTRLPWGWGSA